MKYMSVGGTMGSKRKVSVLGSLQWAYNDVVRQSSTDDDETARKRPKRAVAADYMQLRKDRLLSSEFKAARIMIGLRDMQRCVTIGRGRQIVDGKCSSRLCVCKDVRAMIQV